MSILRRERVALQDLGVPADATVELDVVSRIGSLAFPPGGCALSVEVKPGGAETMKQITLLYGPERFPGSPAEDISDPETGTVVVSAGEFEPPRPSWSELRAMPLPEGEVRAKSFGELFDQARRQLYLLLQSTDPRFRGGREV